MQKMGYSPLEEEEVEAAWTRMACCMLSLSFFMFAWGRAFSEDWKQFRFACHSVAFGRRFGQG